MLSVKTIPFDMASPSLADPSLAKNTHPLLPSQEGTDLVSEEKWIFHGFYTTHNRMLSEFFSPYEKRYLLTDQYVHPAKPCFAVAVTRRRGKGSGVCQFPRRRIPTTLSGCISLRPMVNSTNNYFQPNLRLMCLIIGLAGDLR